MNPEILSSDILISILGGLSSIATGLIGWLFGRKRQNTEIAHMQLDYIAKMDKFYNDIIDNLRKDIEELNEKDRVRSKEMLVLRSLVTNIVNDVCLKKGCAMRVYYTEEELNSILRGNPIENREDEGESNQKI